MEDQNIAGIERQRPFLIGNVVVNSQRESDQFQLFAAAALCMRNGCVWPAFASRSLRVGLLQVAKQNVMKRPSMRRSQISWLSWRRSSAGSSFCGARLRKMPMATAP